MLAIFWFLLLFEFSIHCDEIKIIESRSPSWSLTRMHDSVKLSSCNEENTARFQVIV